jgi:hypothetical protein
MMADVGCLLVQLGNQVKDAGILLFEPAVSQVQLVAEDQSKRMETIAVVNWFHR